MCEDSLRHDIFEDAVCFAVRAHSGAIRKGSNTPYILHPMETAAIVATMTDDREVLAAAVLHDVLEDTAVTAEDLRAAFGERVTGLVRAESEDKRHGTPAADTWLLRKRETVAALLAETRPAVKMIALGDKLSNLRATARDYALLGEPFWKRFNEKDKAKHAWYYRAVGDALTELAYYPAWQEYHRLAETVFGAVGQA